jgi:hypothetical protein
VVWKWQVLLMIFGLEMASFVNGLWFRYGKLCEWSVVWKWQAL